MLLEIILNVVMFVPIGFLMPCVIRNFKYRKTAGFALCFTIFIEVTQLLTHRGFFEFDDIINNFLGACIGMLLYIWFLEKNRRYAKRMLLFIIIYMLGYGAILLTLHTLWLRDSAAAKEEMEAVVKGFLGI
jgi:glycopeptide antibiotics resistance protein